MSARKAESTYRVPTPTLQVKLKGLYPVKRVPHTVFPEEEERKLLRSEITCARLGEGKTQEKMCMAVQSVLNAECQKKRTKGKVSQPLSYVSYASFKEFYENKQKEETAKKKSS